MPNGLHGELDLPSHHPLDCASSPTTAAGADSTRDEVPDGDEDAGDTCESAYETLDAGTGGGKCQGNSPLKMAMMNEAMAEMTELIAPAMAEMMFPMVAGG